MYTTWCDSIFVYEHILYSKGVIDTNITAATKQTDSAASNVAEISMAAITLSAAIITLIAITVATLTRFDEIYLVIFKMF